MICPECDGHEVLQVCCPNCQSFGPCYLCGNKGYLFEECKKCHGKGYIHCGGCGEYVDSEDHIVRGDYFCDACFKIENETPPTVHPIFAGILNSFSGKDK